MRARSLCLLVVTGLIAAASATLGAAPAAASHAVSSVAPSIAAQGRTGVPFTISGSGFVDTVLTDVTVSGSGVTVNDVDYVSPTTLSGTITVTTGATPGARNVTVTQGVVDSDTCTGCLTISARPTVTAVAPSVASNNGVGTTNVTVTGSNFQAGAQLTFVDGAFTIPATEGTITSTSLAAAVDLRGQPPGLVYDVVVTNPDQGVGQLTNGFSLGGNAPTLTAVSSPVGRGAVDKVVHLTGTNLARGATITVTPAAGITVGPMTWVSLTQVDVPLTVDGTAATGAHDVKITNTDTQNATCAGCLTINAAPSITSVVPNARGQGAAAVNVDVTGTGFVAGQSTFTIDGTGVTVANLVATATQITADVTVAPSAATGSRTLTVTNPDGGTATATFTVSPGPAVSTVTPNARGQGSMNQTVTLAGSAFGPSATVDFGPGVTLNGPVVVDSPTQITVHVDVDAAATAGPRDVKVTNTDGGTATKVGGFTVGNGPVITTVSPVELGRNSSNRTVVVAGSGFQPGVAVAFSSPAGITIHTTTLNSATQITLDVSVSNAAALGARNVTVTNTDAGTATSTGAVTINPSPAVTSADPDTVGRGGSTTVSVVGSSFAGTPTVSFGTGVAVSDVDLVDAQHLNVAVSVAPDAVLGARDINVTNPDGGAAAPCVGCFTVAAAPTLSSITPSSGAAGGSVGITDLAGTGFQIGATVVLERVGYADVPLAVTGNDGTHITGTFDLTDAAPGAWTVKVTNPDLGTARLPGGFNVAGNSPAITSVAPSSLLQGRSQTVVVNGTGFAPGSTISVSGAGITVGSTTVNAARTQLSATFTLAAGAAPGPRDVTATNTDAQSTTCAGCFTVVATPVIGTVAPASLAQGVSNIDVVITGSDFQATPTVTVSGAGVTVGTVTRDSATQLTVKVSVDPAAATTARDVTVTNPDTGSTTATGALTVTGGPKVSSISPTSVPQGRTGHTLTVTGTGFQTTPTVAFAGAGVTVDSVVRNSATQVTVTISVAPDATASVRDMTVTNPDGGSVVAANALTVVAAGGAFTGVTPARILDTRTAGQGPCLGGSAVRSLKVTNVGGVPAAGVGSVALNVTSAGSTAESYLTVYPTGVTRPTASNLNFVAGQIIPNTVMVKVDTGGFINIFNSAGCAHVIVDVVGWYLDNGGAPARGGFAGVTPARILDTRLSGQGPCVGAAAVRSLKVTGLGGVPATGAGSVALNVTSAGSTAESYLTVYPTGVTRPTASNLNFLAGRIIPNTVIAKIGTGGFIDIYNEAGCTQVLVDVVGWYLDDAGAPAPGGFVGVTPARVVDTRIPAQGPCVGAAAVRDVKVTGVGGVPTSGVGSVALNVTSAGSTAESYLTVFPKGVARPLASNLNFTTGVIIPNTVLAKVGTGGFISVYNEAGCSHVIVDVVGWYTS